ncbi:MAG: hypothetical protein WHW07_00075 [Bacteroidales bacterium]|jgi:hypothetical protein|nr:hypothetical protein [Bacteroidales bacterium]HOL97794.1 hypothetical protein [Bacteroidales bacterium]HOM35843.1 hypothetical protein [Bacteroidales bacterium]HPD23238.1 hypothetical protein [Bacteroidales bacterium]HRS99242.1 hypothetical protein [Bacteroidales bacterium]
MIKFIGKEETGQSFHTFIFECESVQSLANHVSETFIKRGYKLKDGNSFDGSYEKGDRILRLLFGAFVKYFKFKIKIENNKLHIHKESSGMSGGLIGMNQVNKEFNAIVKELTIT